MSRKGVYGSRPASFAAHIRALPIPRRTPGHRPATCLPAYEENQSGPGPLTCRERRIAQNSPHMLQRWESSLGGREAR